jgi:predicted dehydrogenase
MGRRHAQSAAALPNVVVSWIADQDLALASTLAEPLGARPTTDLGEAAAAENVDAVIVALPTPAHRGATELAAAHGKHVFCEKPIARTLADGQAMIDACRQAGVRLMIGHVVRFYPEYARIRDLLESGAIGTVGLARASRLNQHPRALRPWYADLETSGGLVVDMMIHDLDTLRWYFGEVERVFAHGLSYTDHAAAVDYAVAVLRFTNGVIAHIDASWAHARFRTAIEIAGEAGIIRHDSDQSSALRIERTDDDERSRGVLIPSSPQAEGPYEAELRHFVESLRSGEQFLVEAEDGLTALSLALAVLESIRTGRPVHLNPSARHEVVA